MAKPKPTTTVDDDLIVARELAKLEEFQEQEAEAANIEREVAEQCRDGVASFQARQRQLRVEAELGGTAVAILPSPTEARETLAEKRAVVALQDQRVLQARREAFRAIDGETWPTRVRAIREVFAKGREFLEAIEEVRSLEAETLQRGCGADLRYRFGFSTGTFNDRQLAALLKSAFDNSEPIISAIIQETK